MRLMVQLFLFSIFAILLTSRAAADDKKELYDKGVAATAAGDPFAASDAFCELSRKDNKYKDANEQCQVYTSLKEKTLYRYRVNFADGMEALRIGDFVTAEKKFRNVKRGDFAEQAKQQLTKLSKWKEQYPPIRSKRKLGAPSILFGDAEIGLGMDQDEIVRRLAGASRHLKLAASRAATVMSDKDDLAEGEIAFDNGNAISVIQKMTAKTPEDLAVMLATAVSVLDENTCNLQNEAASESDKPTNLVMFCGNYVLTVSTRHQADKTTPTTEIAIQIGSTRTSAQVAAKAAVVGTVFSKTGAPMPGVVVLLENKDTGFIKTSTTGSDGSYTITGVPPAAGYKISAATADGSRIGFSREHVDITPGSEKEVLPPLREPVRVAPHR